jgi:hypothetical protein
MPADQAKQEEQLIRIKAFLKEYGDLVQKHDIDFANYPVFAPDGKGAFTIIVQSTPIDRREMAVKSPMSEEFISKDK